MTAWLVFKLPVYPVFHYYNVMEHFGPQESGKQYKFGTNLSAKQVGGWPGAVALHLTPSGTVQNHPCLSLVENTAAGDPSTTKQYHSADTSTQQLTTSKLPALQARSATHKNQTVVATAEN